MDEHLRVWQPRSDASIYVEGEPLIISNHAISGVRGKQDTASSGEQTLPHPLHDDEHRFFENMTMGFYRYGRFARDLFLKMRDKIAVPDLINQQYYKCIDRFGQIQSSEQMQQLA